MPEPFKDMLYRRDHIVEMAALLHRLHPPFDEAAFLAQIFDDAWNGEELKQRMRHIALALRAQLPRNYRAALEVLKQAAPQLNQHGFLLMSFNDFVEAYGLDDWEASLPAFERITQYMSAEFAVRPFIARDTPRMMAQMLAWSRHESEHVRRLSSEGSRPRLPWAMALPMFKKDPSPILPVLENLKDDPSETVRRSVANNLNDIAKDNPDVVVDTLRRWQPDASAERQGIIRHALRTLVKAGNKDALGLLGYDAHADVIVKNLALGSDTVRFGEALTFAFEIEAKCDAPQNLVVDYVVYHQKANGSLAPKVFKLTTRQINPGETIRFERRHAFVPITTRKYYAGEHALAVKINGQEFEDKRFTLVME